MPDSPLSPVAPRIPVGPDTPESPLSPVAPRIPVEPDLEERSGLGVSMIFLVDSFTLVGVILSDVFLNGTSKTEYNEENKSLTTTQIVFKSLTDEGSGFLESPIVSEKIPSLTCK